MAKDLAELAEPTKLTGATAPAAGLVHSSLEKLQHTQVSAGSIVLH